MRSDRALREERGGAEGNRTPDLLDANETRYQLRYSPRLSYCTSVGQ